MRKRGAHYDQLRKRARRLVSNDEHLVMALANMREKKGLSLETVSRRMGITVSELVAVDGGMADPTLGQIRRYAHAVGAVVEHRVVDDEPSIPVASSVSTDSTEPVAVVHHDGSIELSSVPYDPSLGAVQDVEVIGNHASETVQTKAALV